MDTSLTWLDLVRVAAVVIALVPVAVYGVLEVTARRRRDVAVARLEAAQLSVQTATAQQEAVKARHEQLVAHARWWHVLLFILPLLAAVGSMSRLVSSRPAWCWCWRPVVIRSPASSGATLCCIRSAAR